jgi:hypothetical protein
MTISRREFLAHSAASLWVHLGSAAQPRLRLATFQAEVTPPIGHPLIAGAVAPAKEIIDPLYAQGFVLLGAGDPIVFVTVDWCEIRNDAYDQWRDRLAEAVGTKRQRVLVSSVHQHDAPVADLTAQRLLEAAKAKGAICDLEFHAKAVERVARQARQALRQTQPVTHVGTGEEKVEQVASNRRYVDDAGRVQFGRTSATRDPKARAAEEGVIDPKLKTLSFWNGDTPLLALHVYAVHPMSYYGQGGVSADFVGLARKLRQADEPAVMQMYASGCSGNVTAGKYNDGSTENRPVLARRLHVAMQGAWKKTQRRPLEICEFRLTSLQLPVRTSKGFSEQELQEQLEDDNHPFRQSLAAMGLSWRKRVAAGQAIDVPAIDFGGPVLLLLPAESYVEYQLYAQSLRPEGFVVTVGYGECAPGYIPIEKAWEENDGNLSVWCWVDPGCESHMKKAIEAVLRRA